MARGDVCTIPKCKNIIKRSGSICKAHQNRMYRHGSYDISPNWNNLKKGMVLPDGRGYSRINVKGKRILHHRYIIEQHLGRKLQSSEKIHHINGNKTDNRIENLEIVSQSYHKSHYHPKKPLVDWSKLTIPPKTNRWQRNQPTKCLVNSCTNSSYLRTLCKKHYYSFNYFFNTHK